MNKNDKVFSSIFVGWGTLCIFLYLLGVLTPVILIILVIATLIVMGLTANYLTGGVDEKWKREKIIKRLEKSFKEEDKNEHFSDREYVGEILRVLKILKGDSSGSNKNSTDKAIYDIVVNIFREV